MFLSLHPYIEASAASDKGGAAAATAAFETKMEPAAAEPVTADVVESDDKDDGEVGAAARVEIVQAAAA